jgi:predicted CopG family antitoxin
MTLRTKTIQLPEDIYDRLKSAANAESVDPAKYIEKLLEEKNGESQKKINEDTEIAPLYRLHELAIDMGITDLAQNLDHYLYGLDKDDND